MADDHCLSMVDLVAVVSFRRRTIVFSLDEHKMCTGEKYEEEDEDEDNDEDEDEDQEDDEDDDEEEEDQEEEDDEKFSL